MSTNYRCTRTAYRKRLSLPNRAKHVPLCPSCHIGHLSEDPEPKRRTRRQTCTCSELPYPHRRGTNFCAYGPRLDDEDYRAHLRHLQRTVKW
jgi:hypothetical protein